MFDWVVMLGALEHFGLGYYKKHGRHDPIDRDGDTKTIAHVAERLLRPGGCLYFDVPFNPEYSVNEHYRTYDIPARARLMHPFLTLHRLGWSLNAPHIDLLPSLPVVAHAPYHLMAVYMQKGY
jgi:hypothetical protein